MKLCLQRKRDNQKCCVKGMKTRTVIERTVENVHVSKLWKYFSFLFCLMAKCYCTIRKCLKTSHTRHLVNNCGWMNEVASSLMSVPNSVGCIRNAQKNILKLTDYWKSIITCFFPLLLASTSFFKLFSIILQIVVRGPQNLFFSWTQSNLTFVPNTS